AVYDDLDGVLDVESGYSGGAVKDPTYYQVCSGRTGHAEVVQVRYDPTRITFRELLEVFFSIHDPTTLNRQGGDVGTQYRSAVFYHDDAQRREAEEIIRELTADGVFEDPIVTKLEPFTEFWPAEAEHEEYYRRNPQAGYCQAVIAPKLAKFRQKFAGKMR
ncbi:MAG TPA: peptide-methionine (S)-S-oxide reductase MsrA, partial [Deinococcales bacterium]|nr:peptide-methionine (S)-S-oxide reductase MsrA [Deinococcales bacterium]